MGESPRVDLHTHTTRSDGNAAPQELVRLALEAGLDVLAVTDHDAVEAIPECAAAAKGTALRILPGIEMSALFEGRDVHVLGYGLDTESPELLARLGALHENRRERVRRICAKLQALGAAVEASEVLSEAGGKSVGRRHVARALLKRGLVRTIDEAFRRFLAEGSPANVPAQELTPRDASDLILRHGGIPVLAHPGFLDDNALVERILDAAPFRGIEVFHHYNSATKHLSYLEMALRRNLLVTGGSDFHADEHAHNAPLGASVCPPAHWKDLEMRLGAQ